MLKRLSRLSEERGRVVEQGEINYQGYAEADLVGVTSEALPVNSGGPLLDRNGDVIGVVVALDRSGGLILAIPLADEKKFLEDSPDVISPEKCD